MWGNTGYPAIAWLVPLRPYLAKDGAGERPGGYPNSPRLETTYVLRDNLYLPVSPAWTRVRHGQQSPWSIIKSHISWAGSFCRVLLLLQLSFSRL